MTGRLMTWSTSDEHCVWSRLEAAVMTRPHYTDISRSSSSSSCEPRFNVHSETGNQAVARKPRCAFSGVYRNIYWRLHRASLEPINLQYLQFKLAAYHMYYKSISQTDGRTDRQTDILITNVAFTVTRHAAKIHKTQNARSKLTLNT